MKTRTLLAALTATGFAGGSFAAPVTIGVTEDGFVDAVNDQGGNGGNDGGYGNNNIVQDGGVGDKLSLHIPNPAGAWQYTRRALFGFDVSSINLGVSPAGP